MVFRISPDNLSEQRDSRLIVIFQDCFLRSVEHRIQMVADEQSQTLPEDQAAFERLARFAGFFKGMAGP